MTGTTIALALGGGLCGLMVGGTVGVIVGATLGARRRSQLEQALLWYEDLIQKSGAAAVTSSTGDPVRSATAPQRRHGE